MKLKKRSYYYIEGKDSSNPSQLKFIKREIDCEDTFEDELIMLAFPMGLLKEISSVLTQFNLRDDAEYFYSECREVVSVPEKHVNEKGEGKLTFQSYFHKFPDSVQHFFDDAIVVVVLHPQPGTGEESKGDYNMLGYIHVNLIDFKDATGQIHPGYYYNILRLSEREVNGEAIYRRKRIFTTLFNVLHDLTDLNDIHFAYSSMGRENQAINDAVRMNVERHGKFADIVTMRNNTHVNLLYGSGSAAKKMIDISTDRDALREYYSMIKDLRGPLLFNQIHSEEKFFAMTDRILSSSPTSRIYMMPDAKGNFAAAGFFINWGDYLHLKLQNPKGIFKVIDALHLTDKLLYPTLLVEGNDATRQLAKGAAYRYLNDHNVKLTVMNAISADPHFEVKKSLIHDPFVYFVIYDRPEIYHAMKEHSKDEAGNVRLFIDTPML
ncbi:MAG: hypothetical protein IPP77_02255 [Bacteroidetes bacterium]|nr:hypothetical protein [Bacteroidota bacterium]